MSDLEAPITTYITFSICGVSPHLQQQQETVSMLVVRYMDFMPLSSMERLTSLVVSKSFSFV